MTNMLLAAQLFLENPDEFNRTVLELTAPYLESMPAPSSA